MGRPLDGDAFKIYCRRLGFNKETQDMIARILASKPSDDLYGNRGSTYVGYLSKEMGGIIRAESCKVEFPPTILELEYSSEYE